MTLHLILLERHCFRLDEIVVVEYAAGGSRIHLRNGKSFLLTLSVEQVIAEIAQVGQ